MPDPAASGEGGYLNAHCHLELSALRGRIKPGQSFPEWVSQLLPLWNSISPDERREAARRGVSELRDTGTRAVLDISARDEAIPALQEAATEGFRSVTFRELLSLDPNQATPLLERLGDRISGCPAVAEAISPHAPYSVSVALFGAAKHYAETENQWICIHAAEFPEETEFLLSRRGALAEFLEPFLPPNWQTPGLRPIPYLDSLGMLGPKTLLVHCNEVTEDEARLLSRRGVSVVVCPGTHVYFDRGRFPLPLLLEAGVSCYIGTDSLASNEKLDMQREIDLAVELSERKLSRQIVAELVRNTRLQGFLQA